MAEPVIFYRFTDDSSLPSFEDGAVYIIPSETTKEEIKSNVTYKYYNGDMYVDISPTERLQVKQANSVDYFPYSQLANDVRVSVEGRPYVLINESVPYIAMGDGQNKIKELQSVYQLITAEDRARWNREYEIKTTVMQGTTNEYNLKFELSE